MEERICFCCGGLLHLTAGLADKETCRVADRQTDAPKPVRDGRRRGSPGVQKRSEKEELQQG